MGSVGIAAVRAFFTLVWIDAVSGLATAILYKLHSKVASKISASFLAVSLALTGWAYFEIWGFVWFH